MLVHVIVVVGLLVCAVQAVRAQRLLHSALWLAGTSALVALEMYMLGAPEVAVIELSVGAGLVTVLFVFAINIAGDEAISAQPIVPKPLAALLVLAVVLLLIWMNARILTMQVTLEEVLQLPFKNVMWGDRVLDTMLQVVLIFCGVLGVLGLLSESKTTNHVDHAAEMALDTPEHPDLVVPPDDRDLVGEHSLGHAGKENG